MTRPRLASLFSHIALGTAGICLTVAEQPYLPELPLFLVFYLFFIGLSWRRAGHWVLPGWLANFLGLLLVGLVAGWMSLGLRETSSTLWLRDVPIAAALVPYLGPVLMGLLLIRLYQPRSLDDFWLLQGLGLLQVALGCILASGTLFGLFLLAYIVSELCALAAHVGHRQGHTSETGQLHHPGSSPAQLITLSLRWTLAIAACALPLFLLTPRVEGPEWEPFARFGIRRTAPKMMRSGFSEEIDLTLTGNLELDETVAFTVLVRDGTGRPGRRLPLDQRWRGIVLDRYDDGVWRCELNWPSSVQTFRRAASREFTRKDRTHVEFRVPSKVGGLFLAEPVLLGPMRGVLPVISQTDSDNVPLFFEAGGTIVAITYLAGTEHRYVQILPLDANQQRWPAVRVQDGYLHRLIRQHLRLTRRGMQNDKRGHPRRSVDLQAWTRQLLNRLVPKAGNASEVESLRQALRRESTEHTPLPPGVWELASRLLTDHLANSGEYSYSLTFSRGDPAIDPTADFLMNVKRGACERYASGLALMLRSLGIPSRVVKGYRGGEYLDDGLYYIRQCDAHAWVEALVPAKADPTREAGRASEGTDSESPARRRRKATGIAEKMSFDWLVLDATPMRGGTDSTSGLLRWWQQQQRSGQSLWQDLIVGYDARQQANLWETLVRAVGLGDSEGGTLNIWVPGLVGLGMLGGAWWIWRRRRRKRVRAAGPAGLYEQLQEVLEEQLRLRADSHQTPRELASEASVRLQQRPGMQALVDVPGRVVEAYYQARYGGRVIGEMELEQLQGQVEALSATLARARMS